jgi:hypothetical protein
MGPSKAIVIQRRRAAMNAADTIGDGVRIRGE